MSEQPTIAEFVDEFVRDARALLDHAEEAAEHLAAGDPRAACSAVAISHYKIGQVGEDRRNLLERFALEGIQPGFDDA